MTLNKISDEEQKEMTRLAPIVAEFMEWEKRPCKITGEDTWFYCGNWWAIDEIKIHFFDPDNSPPNPRGFIQVLDRLDEKFNRPSVKFIFGTIMPDSINYSCLINAWDLRERVEGNGPNRYIALYRAVEQLMEGEDEN